MFTGIATNPEDVDGIKEAISILENQETGKIVQSNNEANAIQIITPLPFVDERNNHRVTSNASSPVYRENRNFNNSNSKSNSRRTSAKRNPPELETQNSEFKLVTVNADMNFNRTNKSSNSAENTSKLSSSENMDRKHRRRMTLRNSNTPTNKTTLQQTNITTSKPIEVTTSSVDIFKQEIQPNHQQNISEVKQEKLVDQVENSGRIDATILKEAVNSPPVKRFYRSSAERESNKDEKEMTIVNNEKVQIIRPTSMSRLVGEYPTPTATIAKLDEAVLGSPYKARFKKEIVSIVTPQRHEDVRSPTDRYRT